MAPFDKRHPNAVLELIIHAGDVGRPEIIEQLNAIAPTHAVRGNVDTQSWARTLPDTRVVEGRRAAPLRSARTRRARHRSRHRGLCGSDIRHSHTPSIETRSDVLYINPGSAGPRRFRLPITIARVRISGLKLEPEIVELEV